MTEFTRSPRRSGKHRSTQAGAQTRVQHRSQTGRRRGEPAPTGNGMGPDLKGLADRYSTRHNQAGGRSALPAGERRSKKLERMRRYEERFAPPPVMVRGNTAFNRLGGVPGDLINFPAPMRGRGSKARRRYDVPLNVPGAEMRLPALPEIRLGWRLLSALMVAAIGFALYQLWNMPQFRVQEAEVTGVQRLTGADVNAVLDIADEPIFMIQAEQLQQKLVEAFPEFSSASVEVDFPASVLVTVEERQPILTWKAEGRTLLVDANGVAFPLRDNALPGPTLTVEAANQPPQADFTGGENGPAPYLPVEMVSAIVSMSGQSPENTPILYDNAHGLGWRDRRGWAVYFGGVQDMGTKLNVYRAMLTYFKEEGIKPQLVSVEHVHAPYFRLEQ